MIRLYLSGRFIPHTNDPAKAGSFPGTLSLRALPVLRPGSPAPELSPSLQNRTIHRPYQLVLKIADADTLPPHILLGTIQLAHQAEQARAAAADRWKAVSASIDMDAVGPIPALPKA